MNTLNFANIKNVLLPEGVVKKIAVGGQTLWKAYDAEVEYLESNGNCNVYTSYIPSGTNMRIEGKFLHNGWLNATSYSPWFTAYSNEQKQAFRIIRSGTSDSHVLAYNGTLAGGGYTLVPVTIGSTYTFVFTTSEYNWNGTAYTPKVVSNQLNTSSLNIFGLPFKGRFYYLRFIKNGVLEIDLIPVRIGTTGYLYDKVQGKLYGNAGTGSFTIGPDVRVL